MIISSIIYTLLNIPVILPAALIAIIVHNYSIAFFANWVGDKEPAISGFLTMNPLKHFSPIGSFLLLVTGFGWQERVEINIKIYKKPTRLLPVIFLFGSLCNIVIAFFLIIVFRFNNFTLE